MSALVTAELLDRVRERLTASSVAEPTAATVADAVRASPPAFWRTRICWRSSGCSRRN